MPATVYNCVCNNTTQSIRNATLDEAKKIINGERLNAYGVPENSFDTIAKLWSIYLNKDISTAQVADMMILLKIARNSSGFFKDDNWVDICGYAALGSELSHATKENK